MEKEELKNICDDFFNCVKRISGSDGGFVGFGKFLDRRAGNNEAWGIKKSTILGDAETHFKKLNKWCDKGGELDGTVLEELDFYNEKARRFCKWAKTYLESIKGDFDIGQKFYLYFMYFDRYFAEPQLGRAVLEIVDYNKAKCDNLSTGKTYDGHFHSLAGHYIFELTSADDIGLHIKAGHFKPEKDEIFLGAYITYEDEHIVTGSVVLEKCDEAEPVPIALSWFNNSVEFNGVHESIKRFLSIRKHCYQKIPNKITSKIDLSKFLNHYNEDWTNRFFELKKPTMFVALHTNSIQMGDNFHEIENIAKKISDLKEEYKHGIEVNYFDGSSPSPNGESDNLLLSMRLLTRTRLFVIILNETTQHSFALVQLGWAIAHCKQVLVIYKEGCVSDMLKHLVYLNPENKKIKIRLFPFKDMETFENCLDNVRVEMNRCLNLNRLSSEEAN
jgi:hypothetical protein